MHQFWGAVKEANPSWGAISSKTALGKGATWVTDQSHLFNLRKKGLANNFHKCCQNRRDLTLYLQELVMKCGNNNSTRNELGRI